MFVITIIIEVLQISIESKLPLDENDYVDSFKTMLMDVVYAWSEGKSFSKIMDLCDTYEGLFLSLIINNK